MLDKFNAVQLVIMHKQSLGDFRRAREKDRDRKVRKRKPLNRVTRGPWDLLGIRNNR